MKAKRTPEGLRRYHERARRNAKNSREQWRTFIRGFKKGLTCEHCGEVHGKELQFHHCIPEDKEFNIAKAIRFYWSKKNRKVVLKEISKCLPLCDSCHREEHKRIRSA